MEEWGLRSEKLWLIGRKERNPATAASFLSLSVCTGCSFTEPSKPNQMRVAPCHCVSGAELGQPEALCWYGKMLLHAVQTQCRCSRRANRRVLGALRFILFQLKQKFRNFSASDTQNNCDRD